MNAVCFVVQSLNLLLPATAVHCERGMCREASVSHTWPVLETRCMLDHLFVLISYGVLKGAAVRMRTQVSFMLFIFIGLIDAELVLFRLFGASARQGAVCLFLTLPMPWVISRYIEPYVNNNWRLFSPKSKDQVRYLWAGRLAAYVLFLALLIAFVWSGIEHFDTQNASGHMILFSCIISVVGYRVSVTTIDG